MTCQLGASVQDDHGGLAPPGDDPAQFATYTYICEGGVDHDRQNFPGEVIDHGKRADAPPSEAVSDAKSRLQCWLRPIGSSIGCRVPVARLRSHLWRTAKLSIHRCGAVFCGSHSVRFGLAKYQVGDSRSVDAFRPGHITLPAGVNYPDCTGRPTNPTPPFGTLNVRSGRAFPSGDAARRFTPADRGFSRRFPSALHCSASARPAAAVASRSPLPASAADEQPIPSGHQT